MTQWTNKNWDSWPDGLYKLVHSDYSYSDMYAWRILVVNGNKFYADSGAFMEPIDIDNMSPAFNDTWERIEDEEKV